MVDIDDVAIIEYVVVYRECDQPRPWVHDRSACSQTWYGMQGLGPVASRYVVIKDKEDTYFISCNGDTCEGSGGPSFIVWSVYGRTYRAHTWACYASEYNSGHRASVWWTCVSWYDWIITFHMLCITFVTVVIAFFLRGE